LLASQLEQTSETDLKILIERIVRPKHNHDV